jgi:beta-ribofuranosylaminobenzene 5'-phosphate synthase
MDIALSLNEIEKQVGRLSPMQKFLLGTDGSVTQILEAITGNRVVIETRVQKIIAADPKTAERLGIRQDDPVNYRVVDIKTPASGEVLIHAISHTPIARLSPEFKDDLMKADIPIGRIIQNHRIEARLGDPECPGFSRIRRSGQDFFPLQPRTAAQPAVPDYP